MEVSTDNLPSESPSSDESVTSLYSGIENSDLPNKYFKVEEFESKLAQTANIEDHVMLNEEEIAKVGRQADEKAQNERDKITGRSQRFESFHLKSTNGLSVEWDPTGNAYPNHRITTSGKTSDRESVIIKSEGRCERLDYESDLEDNYDKGKPNLSEKEESMNLKCNEDIGSLDSSGEERRVPDDDLNPKPPKLSYHYTDHYGGGVDYIHGQRSEDHKITNDRNSTDRKTLPLFYIQGYPHVQVPHSNIQTQQINMLGEAIYTQDPRAYVVRHVDYSNQEQRVPLMGQTDAEQNPAGKQALQFPSSTIHYTPDQGVIQTGFANIPNMGLYNFTHGDIARGDKSCYDKFSPGSNVQSAPYQRDGNVKKSPGSGSVTARGQSEAGKQQKVTFSSAATTPQSVPNQAVILPSVSPVYERNTASPATSEQTRDSPQASSDEDGPKPKTNQGFLIRGRPRKSTLPKNEGGVQCNVCNKTFGSSSALAKHKLTHSDERRYICPICSKGFKRQDHLNGHKVTHQDKKPYECSVPDCDKSYCDMRSLRRHLENHHAAGQTVPGMSATPSNTKTTTSTVTAVTVVPEVGNAANTSGVKSRTIKVENDNSKSEAPAQRPQTLPIWSTGTSSDMLSPEAEMLKKMAGIKGSPASSHSSTPMRERSSNSFSSVSSEEIHQMKEEKKDVEVPSLRDRNKATTAVEMLRQAAGMVQEQRNTQQNVQQDPLQYSTYKLEQGGLLNIKMPCSITNGVRPCIKLLHKTLESFTSSISSYIHNTACIRLQTVQMLSMLRQDLKKTVIMPMCELFLKLLHHKNILQLKLLKDFAYKTVCIPILQTLLVLLLQRKRYWEFQVYKG